MLRHLDTGISHISSERVPFERIQLPDSMRTEIEEQLSDDMVAILEDSSKNQFLVEREDGELIVKKRVAMHKMADGAEAKFTVSQESDGSQRLIHLLPAFVDVARDECTLST